MNKQQAIGVGAALCEAGPHAAGHATSAQLAASLQDPTQFAIAGFSSAPRGMPLKRHSVVRTSRWPGYQLTVVHMNQIALFGVRSPLTVEYEETCQRAGIAVKFAVSVAGAPRLYSAVPIVELDDLSPGHLETACIVCAFSPMRRRALAEAAVKAGFAFADALVDPTSTIASSTNLGAGSYVNAGCVIGALSIIGNHVLLNRSSSAGHHAVLADYVSVGPGVTLAGNIRVGEGAVIGTGSTILPGIRIGAGAVVAAGSVVRRDVRDGTMVAGNPAIERAFDPLRSSLYVPGAE